MCKAGVVVIGRNWLASTENQAPRLHENDDVVRGEIEAMLDRQKAVFPVLTEGGPTPGAIRTAENPDGTPPISGHLDR